MARAISGWVKAKIRPANKAAFFAPASPMAKVAVGIPAGIWTIDNMLSIASRHVLLFEPIPELWPGLI